MYVMGNKKQRNNDVHTILLLFIYMYIPSWYFPSLVVGVIDFDVQSVVGLLSDLNCQRGDG